MQVKSLQRPTKLTSLKGERHAMLSDIALSTISITNVTNND